LLIGHSEVCCIPGSADKAIYQQPAKQVEIISPSISNEPKAVLRESPTLVPAPTSEQTPPKKQQPPISPNPISMQPAKSQETTGKPEAQFSNPKPDREPAKDSVNDLKCLPKDQIAVSVKDRAKELAKDQAAEFERNLAKASAKDKVKESKDHAKEVVKDIVKNQVHESLEDKVKDKAKELAKDQAAEFERNHAKASPKDEAKESKDQVKDHVRESSEDKGKRSSKESAKDQAKETSRRQAKESAKEPAKQPTINPGLGPATHPAKDPAMSTPQQGDIPEMSTRDELVIPGGSTDHSNANCGDRDELPVVYTVENQASSATDDANITRMLTQGAEAGGAAVDVFGYPEDKATCPTPKTAGRSGGPP